MYFNMPASKGSASPEPAKHHLGRAQCSFLRTANFFGIWLDSLESPIHLPAFERRVVTLLHQGIKGTVIVVDTEPIKNRF